MIGYGRADLFNQPNGMDALVGAVTWIEAALLGTVATTIAVLAIAAVGFSMLTGRMAIRRGVTVILGCFIMFGAASIANGLRGMADGAPELPPEPALSETVQASQLESELIASSPPPVPLDPYAGASVRR